MNLKQWLECHKNMKTIEEWDAYHKGWNDGYDDKLPDNVTYSYSEELQKLYDDGYEEGSRNC